MRSLLVLASLVAIDAGATCVPDGTFRSSTGVELIVKDSNCSDAGHLNFGEATLIVPDWDPDPTKHTFEVDAAFGSAEMFLEEGLGHTAPANTNTIRSDSTDKFYFGTIRIEDQTSTPYLNKARLAEFQFSTDDLNSFTMGMFALRNYDYFWADQQSPHYIEYATQWTFYPETAPAGSIQGFAWVDDGDGIRQASEPAEALRTVKLYRCQPPWGIAATAVTSAPDGEFVFTGLAPGLYQMGTGTANVTFSPRYMGGPDEDNDFHSNGFTDCFDAGQPQSQFGIGLQ